MSTETSECADCGNHFHTKGMATAHQCWSCAGQPENAEDYAEQTQNIWALLEADAPAGCEGVQALYSWSLNYEPGKGPFPLFLDLIGWSEEEIGEALFTGSPIRSSLGYTELDKLAKALTEYAARPHDVTDYVSALMAAESGE